MGKPIDVFVLTYCREASLLYGTELIFKTLRKGFPNADVSVCDNASLKETRSEIASLARRSGCHFSQVTEPGVPHHWFLETFLRARAEHGGPDRPLVFLDPDVCLWRNCEDFEFDGLIAGTLIAAHNFEPQGCVVMPRLHSSFLWIQSPRKLMARIGALKKRFFDFEPFRSFTVKLGDVWLRYDTGAGLYAALPNEVSFFGERERSRYDHIFAGSHLDLWRGRFKGRFNAVLERFHEHARKGEIGRLRGMWREMDRAWKKAFRPPGDD